MKYLVTGGAGFIGSNLVRRLLRLGHHVVVLDDLSTGRRENLADVVSTVEFVQASITDFTAVLSAAKGVDGVFHLAAVASVQKSLDDPVGCHDVNVTGALNVMEAARRCGATRVVLSSSAAVYGEARNFPLQETEVCRPISPYGLHKLTNENYGRLYSDAGSLEVVSLRYFNVYGPHQDPQGEYAAVVPKFVTAAVAGEQPLIFGDGGQSRDFMFVEDVANANWLAMVTPGIAGEIINICAGLEISLLELVDALSHALGRTIEPRFLPPREGDIRRSVGDCARAMQLLGITGWTSVADGLAKTVEWYGND